MPKRRRKDRLSLPAPEIEEVEVLEPYWPTTKVPRFWCPCCGMCANVEQLDTSPHEVLGGIQEFGIIEGGKAFMPPYKGNMPNEELLEVLYRLRDLLPEVIDSVNEQIRELGGEEEEEEVQAPQGGYVAAPVVERELPPSLQRKPERRPEPKTLEELSGQLDLLPPLPEDEETFERGELLPPPRRQQIQSPRRQPRQVTGRRKQGQLQPRPQRKQLPPSKPIKRGELKPVEKRKQIQSPKSAKRLPPPNRPGLPPGKK